MRFNTIVPSKRFTLIIVIGCLIYTLYMCFTTYPSALKLFFPEETNRYKKTNFTRCKEGMHLGSITGHGQAIDELKISPKWEHLKRRIRSRFDEMWYVVSTAHLKTEKEELPLHTKKMLKDMIELFDEIRTRTAKDFENLISVDEAEQQVRDETAKELSEIIQKDIYRTQNPTDCDNARKLICSLERRDAGYAAQFHNILQCFFTAYGTNRVAIIDGSMGWLYSKKGWYNYFQNTSNSCWTYQKPAVPWNEHDENNKTVLFPIYNGFEWFAQPQRVPSRFYHPIRSFHGHPYVWWAGQMVKNVCRYVPELENQFKKAMEDIGFRRPIVGVQVRRTNKIFESVYYQLDDYMYWVELYYKRLELTTTVDKKRIFLATDDPEVFQDAKKRYGDYEILGNISQNAGMEGRYTDEGLHGILLDMEILSETDYLVCTFSSNVCRLAYEMMNYKHTDASDRFHSIDTGYIISGQITPRSKAIYSHQAQNETEISFEVGDVIEHMFNVFEKFNQWNGYSKGMNVKTRAVGLFPSYKVEIVDLVTAYDSHYGENNTEIDG